MRSRPIRTDRAALIVFDMVNEFLLEDHPLYMPGAEVLVRRLAPFVDRCRDLGVRIIFIKPRGYDPVNSDLGQLSAVFPERAKRPVLVRGTKGVEIHEALAPRSGDLVIEKRGYSAFAGTGLEDQLRLSQVDTVMISGVATNIGCDTIAREAFIRQFGVVFLSDGTWTRDFTAADGTRVSRDEIQRVVLATMAFAFGRVGSIADVLAELGASDARLTPDSRGAGS